MTSVPNTADRQHETRVRSCSPITLVPVDELADRNRVLTLVVTFLSVGVVYRDRLVGIRFGGDDSARACV